MREIRSYGSARGVLGNRHSYRNHGQQYREGKRDNRIQSVSRVKGVSEASPYHY